MVSCLGKAGWLLLSHPIPPLFRGRDSGVYKEGVGEMQLHAKVQLQEGEDWVEEPVSRDAQDAPGQTPS